MKVSKIICAILILCAGAFYASATPAANAISFKNFDELTDRDLSPEGRMALYLESDLYWYHAETKNFVYHFTSDDDSMRPYYEEAEATYDWIKETLKLSEDTWRKKAHIFVMTKDWAWEKFGERARLSGESAAAFTNGWDLFIHHVDNDLLRVKTVSHELTHLILYRFLNGHPPLFLNEGFAEYISYGAVFHMKGQDNARIARITRIDDQSYIPLEKLTETENYSGDVRTFYIESEALVRYLIRSYGGDKFYQVMKECSEGNQFQYVADRIYGRPRYQLDAEFRAFVTAA